jgi:EAL domain-containing protein (putative c-di-GMP-specific phosphodiesterase class I)
VMVLGDRRLVGFEALVRWQHPEHGLLPPDVFIPVAEQTGLIGAVGRWVLQEACTTAQAWALTEGGEHLTIGVNVSGRQLDDPDFVAHVGLALAASGLAPSNLVLELNEAVLAGDASLPLARFTELRALGVRIAIDDVGTSYTSLAQLSELPVDIMKIDRAFVAAIDDGPRLPAIVRGLLGFGETINVETVAEGIELESQHQLLRQEGCDLGQGFLFAPPLEPADAEALVAEHHHAGTLGGALSPAA